MRVAEDLMYVGVNDHEIDLFEGQYAVKNGMSYNSYVILDEKVAVMDSVEVRFGGEWLENLKTALDVSTFSWKLSRRRPSSLPPKPLP